MAPRDERSARVSRSMWFAVVAVTLAVLVCVCWYGVFAVRATTFPYGMDYAEGEVWQQARLITGNRAYGDIDIYPYVGFEYPPAYYLVALTVSLVSPNFLIAGRLVSILAAVGSAMMVVYLTASFGRGQLPRSARYVAELAAGGLIFTLLPIQLFSTLARVDMLQVCFSLAGIAVSVEALRRPNLLYAAVLLFVFAGFTKQTALAAPLATLAIMIVRTPRVTISAYAAGGALTACLIGFFELRTHGGFLRHIILYNVNRYSFLHYLAYLLYVGSKALPLLLLATASFALYWTRHLRQSGGILPSLRSKENAETARLALLSTYFILATGATLLAGKAGSSVNYFLEFLCCCCVWAGAVMTLFLSCSEPATAATPWFHRPLWWAIPAAILYQCVTANAFMSARAKQEFGPQALALKSALLQRLDAMDKPVLSDDMAMIMQAGKTPPIEPYIFAELEAAGLWDEKKLVFLIKAHKFAAVLTYMDPGDLVFDDRFRPLTAAAILANYPVVVKFGDDRLRLPK